MTILVSDLAASLNAEVVNGAIDIVRSRRPSVLGSISGFASPEVMDADRKIQWLDYKIDARADDATTTETSGAVTVDVANPGKFRSRMVIRNETTSEQMVVDSVAGSTLTIIRGYGSTAAAITAGDVLSIQSTAREENSLADFDAIDQPDKSYNLVQTMDGALEFSDDAQKIAQFGDTNDLQMQIANQSMQLFYQLNNALINGTRGTFTVGGKTSYTTGGMQYFAEQTGGINVDNAAAVLTLGAINAIYEQVFNAGGNVNRIAVGTKLGRKLSSLVSAQYNSQRLSEWSSDEGSLISLPSDLPLFGGVTNIVIDNSLKGDQLFMYDNSKISIVPAAANNSDNSGGWKTMDSTQPGQDGKSLRIVGKMAMRFRDSKTHLARLHNIG
jgi:hypothetical protein